MPQLIVDKFTFDLPAGWTLLKYDDSVYYRKHFNDFAASIEAISAGSRSRHRPDSTQEGSTGR